MNKPVSQSEIQDIALKLGVNINGFDLNDPPVPRKSGSYYNSLVFNCSGGGDGLQSVFLLYGGDGDGHYHCINNVKRVSIFSIPSRRNSNGVSQQQYLDKYNDSLKNGSG